MDFFEAVAKRRSVRSYEPTPVPDEALAKILEAARLAPSAANIQPCRFMVVRDKDKRAKIAEGCRFGRFLAKSPVVIVACGDKRASPRWYTVDTAIATEHLVLAATALGLGTCWIGSFSQEEIRQLLKVPENLEIVAMVALGYPRGKIDLMAKVLHFVRRRKKLTNIVSLEAYGEKPKWKS